MCSMGALPQLGTHRPEALPSVHDLRYACSTALTCHPGPVPVPAAARHSLAAVATALLSP